MKAPKMIKKAQAGFTLIELMIVVAIIGILAAVAIPAYSNYVVKAKVGAAMTSVSSLQTAVVNCMQEAGGDASTCNTANTNSGIPAFTPTKEVSAATVTGSGVITATFAAGIATDVPAGATFSLTPSTVANQTSITWTAATSATNSTAIAVLTKNNITAPAAP